MAGLEYRGVITATVSQSQKEQSAASRSQGLALTGESSLPQFRLSCKAEEASPTDADTIASSRPRGPDLTNNEEEEEEEGGAPMTVVVDDPEYIDTLAKCDIKEYGLSTPRPRVPSAYKASMKKAQLSPSQLGEKNRQRALSNPSSTANGNLFKSRKKLGRSHMRSSSLRFFNFTDQAQICSRALSDDRRDALGYEPCERCRLRGGRCARCKALRTGGGYIILDGSEIPEDERLKRQNRYGFNFGMGHSGYGETERKKRRRLIKGDLDDDSMRLTDSTGGLEENGGGGQRDLGGAGGRGGGFSWGDTGGGGGRGERGLGGGGGGRGGDNGGGRNWGESTDSGGQIRRGTERDSEDDGRGTHNASSDRTGRDRLGSAVGGRGVGNEGHDLDSGRQSVSSQRPTSRFGSRPGSKIGSRPGSSLKRLARGMERRERPRREGDLEKQSRGGRFKGRDGVGGREGDSGSGSDDDDERRRRRRRKGGEGSDDERHDYDPRFRYNRAGGEEEEEEEGGRYTGDLMRFKARKDNVKALQCTLQELQGIDPLDYLAKYCIIDQEKLPNYRRVYDNVDRDEDDEIDMAELDFALKAVNYNLISDAEMTYVHSVLELAGRYRLNFRLFSLIAALSEKVVALDDMVKRLINHMDFEALEVKMKKCKELFYLLADAEHDSDKEGGVVTTSSLAVELQAGGLTQEHVEFVVDRLNHQGKGKVEFLDYLTYVPLFVEIHDNISGNPLDFTRTR